MESGWCVGLQHQSFTATVLGSHHRPASVPARPAQSFMVETPNSYESRDAAPLSDADIIATVLEGDRNAFALLVERYEPVVARTVTAMLGSGAAADDVGQDAMIKLYRNLARFRAEADLKTYVTRIAMNTALDELRRRKRSLSRYLSFSSDVADHTLNSLSDGRDLSEGFALRQAVQTALAELKPRFRAVAVLRMLHGYSPAETADILGISEGTVFSRLSRARHQLRLLLATEIENDG